MTTRPETLNQLFFGAIDRYGSRAVAMRAKVAGAWTSLGYTDVLDRVQAFSLGLLELGAAPGDRIAILSENRPEWAVTDYACLAARCTDVPIYPTLPAKQIEYILRDSGAVAVCVSSRSQLEKLHDIRSHLPALKYIIAFDADAKGDGVLHIDDVYARGRAVRGRYPDWRDDALRVQPNDVATLIYTSGTTGDPKGVMLSHGNIASNVGAVLQVLEVGSDDECLSLLPLSHIFERMAGHYTMFHAGVIINYAESIDTVAADLIDRRPTVAIAVPRLYEKIYARVLENAMSGSPTKQRIFFWAKRNAEAWADYVLAKRRVPPMLAVKKRIADRLVFSKLRARTGGRIRFFCSGGAPLAAEIAKFFYAAGIPILEGYGLTETSPVIAVNTFDRMRLGTVGPPIPGVEVRIADDGEILVRGPNVMQGYYQKPEATAAAFSQDGWFHTGDIGYLDDDGFLVITDRKKDVIVTAGGKNIAPQPIENMAKTSKFVANAVVLGDRRRYPIMLVVPELAPLRAWAEQQGITETDTADLLERPEVNQKMEREVLKTLRDLAQFEMPKKLLLLADDFTIERGELTPTLKVKRPVVEAHYRDRIEALYAEAEGGIHDLAERP